MPSRAPPPGRPRGWARASRRARPGRGRTTGAELVLNRSAEVCDPHQGGAGALIQVLLQIQSEHHWLPGRALRHVAARLEVPLARIQHIATFYKAFSLVPKGRHEISLCTGTACHVRGASRVLHTTEELTGIGPGETDTELRFSLETVNCLGCCALGPVMTVDGDIHGRLSTGDAENVLAKYE